ncbi:MAG: hypothetical protein LBH01_06650 [Verrucomicrobiales bacterium]|nr:hypothetical protein [Verrucomicrobiales bacterium]
MRQLKPLINYHRGRDVFSSFCRLTACALSDGSRESDYLEEAKRWNEKEMTVMRTAFESFMKKADAHPFHDYLGHAWMTNDWGIKETGEFYTPQEVCKLMAGMTFAGVESALASRKYITAFEGSAGSGRMILAAGELFGDQRHRCLFTAI